MVLTNATNEDFVRKDVALGYLMSYMEPYLAAFDVLGIPKMHVDNSRAVTYKEYDYSMSGDPAAAPPKAHTVSAEYAEIGISAVSKKSAILQEKGFAFRVNRDDLRFAEGFDYIDRGYKTMAYLCANMINTDIFSTVESGATDSGVTPTAAWSEDTATPMDDLIDTKAAMRSTTYPYRCNGFLVNYENLKELSKYLVNIDVGGLKQSAIYGMPNIVDDMMHIPIAGNVVGVDSGITEGNLIGIDKNNSCGTFFSTVDPDYGTLEVRYPTLDNKTVRNNIGLNVNVYKENDTHDTVIQVWCDYKFVMMNSHSAVITDGI